MKNINLVIVEDSATDLYVLLHTFKSSPQFNILATFKNGAEFLKELPQLPPFDCLLIEMHIPLMGGLQVAEALQKPTFKIYIHTHGIYPGIVPCLQSAGVHAFTRKEGKLLKLLIPQIIEGDCIYEVQLKDAWILNDKELNLFELEQKFWRELLNPSEKALLHGFANGISLHLISEKSGIDIQTLDKYRKRLLKKLNFKDDAALSAWAIENGF